MMYAAFPLHTNTKSNKGLVSSKTKLKTILQTSEYHQETGYASTVVEQLNKVFTPLSPIARVKLLYDFFEETDILYTSSFGANAVGLLHLMSKVRSSQTVYFVNTSFHFVETLDYKTKLTELLGLKVSDVLPDEANNRYSHLHRLWETDPDLCCGINKVMPLEEVKFSHKIWISGLMAWQTPHRAGLKVFEQKKGILKFHPLVDITEVQFNRYIRYFNLPEHPLKAQGYSSIGCQHCTQKGSGRSGRWQGNGKTECGLHL